MVQRAAARISRGKQLYRLCRRILGRDACRWSRLLQDVEGSIAAANVGWYSNSVKREGISSWQHWKEALLAPLELSLIQSGSTGLSGSQGARAWRLDTSIREENAGNPGKKDEETLISIPDSEKKQSERSTMPCGSSPFKITGGSLRFHRGYFQLPGGSRVPLPLRFHDLFVRRGIIIVSLVLVYFCTRANNVFSSDATDVHKDLLPDPESYMHSHRAVVTALWCNFLVFSLKIGAWLYSGSHVMLAESVHSLADLANQGLLAYGLVRSRRAPDALHPYGYQKERFVWSLISAVGIFCLGSGATIVHGVQHLWDAAPIEHVGMAAFVLVGSAVMEGASLLVAMSAVRKGAASEGMTLKEYLWRGHDPTSVAVLMEDGAAVTGLAIAAAALAAVQITGNPMWDPVGSIIVGNLLGVVAIFLIQRNRQALIGRSIDDTDMKRIIKMLSSQAVVDAVYDCKSEVIGPGQYRFKAEIDFNGVQIVQNYLERAGRAAWVQEFRDAVNDPREGAMDRVMANYGEEVVSALGSEVDRLEKEIQLLVPGIRHVDIEAHNPKGPSPGEKFYSSLMEE